jgi:hypothetical protein
MMKLKYIYIYIYGKKSNEEKNIISVNIVI